MAKPWIERVLPAALRFHRAVKMHHAGGQNGRFREMPADETETGKCRPQHIHFWTPHPWFSTVVHVEHVLPQLRAQAAGRGLPFRFSAGPELPEASVDWLVCLKAVPPAGFCCVERTVLALPDNADRVWNHLNRFGHVVSVTSRALASLLGTVHPSAWFMEETESPEWIENGRRALDEKPPSRRPPQLLWHGGRESLEGLRRMLPALAAFARETEVELVVLTNQKAHTGRLGVARLRREIWSPAALITQAAQARLSIVPARPALADSHLKSAGRQRRVFALGCPAIGDARVADVVDFSRLCGVPAATTPDEWLTALRELWHDPAKLDEIARRGHAQVRDGFSTVRTAVQWLWFFSRRTGP